MNTSLFLDHFPGNTCYCVLDDKRKIPGLTHFHEGYDLSRNQILDELTEANNAGFGIFFCVNEIDRRLDPRRQRTAKMLTNIRAVWADMDEPAPAPKKNWPLKPSLVVLTSPGKYHYYWLTSTDNVEEWRQVMNGIANTFHSDANARDTVRVLRLPGFNHMKGDPFLSKVVRSPGTVYDWKQITENFPPDETTPSASIESTNENIKIESYKEAKENIVGGTNYHGSIMWLLNHWVNKGISDPDELYDLITSMLGQADVQDERWEARNEEHYLKANINDSINFVKDNPFEDEEVDIEVIDEDDMQSDLGWPPGLMGQLCHEIYEMAPHPNQEIAILAGFTLVAGIAGRTFNVSGTGLNLYTACLARSGIGKATLKNSINKALLQVGALNNGASFLGPARITGPKALLKILHEAPSRILIMEESGLLSASSAGDMPGISRILLDLYTSSGSGEIHNGEEYSNKEDSSSILFSPSVTIGHVSTPESYIKALKSKDSANSGELARIWTIRTLRDKAYLNSDRRLEFSKDVTERIVQLLGVCKVNQNKDHKDKPKIIDMSLDLIDVEDESKYWVDLENKTVITDPVKATIASRAFVKILKIASVSSVFNDTGNKVGIDEYTWAKNAITEEFKSITTAVTLGDSSDMDIVVQHTVIPSITKIVNYQYKDKKMVPAKAYKGKGIFTKNNLYHCLKNSDVIKQMDSDTQKSSVAKTGIQKCIDYMINMGLITKMTTQSVRAIGGKGRIGDTYKITEDMKLRIKQSDGEVAGKKVVRRD